MKLTEGLKKHVREKFGVAADATDEQIAAVVLDKLKSGDLPMDVFTQLNTEKAATDPLKVIDERVQAGVKPVLDVVSSLAESVKALITAKVPVQEGPPAKTEEKTAEKPAEKKETDTPDPWDMLVSSTKMTAPGGVSVKGVHEKFSNTKTAAICPQFTKRLGHPHPNAGQPAQLEGRILEHPSQLDKAVAGAYVKFCLRPNLHELGESARRLRMTELDWELLKYAAHDMPWGGVIGSNQHGEGKHYLHNSKLNEWQRKDLLDDSTSGGLEIAPIVFDDMIMLTPVLHSELFPLVNVVPITRGRRIEGASMSNPTFTSGTAEGTAITAFDTTSFIAAIDTTIYPVVSAVYIGLDFEEDSPIAVADTLITQFGEKLAEWLDNQIANGDGTTEPQGVFNASGTTAVTAVGGANAPQVVADYENLFFGVSKAFRTKGQYGNRLCFMANDTSYKRARAIPVGSDDARRVFGMDHQSYSLLNVPYKIQNDIANTKIAFANLAGYRLYRRLGMTVRVESGGQQLVRQNEKLIVVRGRFGGKLMLGGYSSVMTDAAS